MAQIYNYPNTNHRITRTNLTTKCGSCNSAPILQDAFFAPSGAIQKTLTTIINTSQSIKKEITKIVSKSIQNVASNTKKVFKILIKNINLLNIKRSSISVTKIKIISLTGTIQKIKNAIKTLATTVQLQANRASIVSKSITKTIISSGTIGRLLTLFRTFSVNIGITSFIKRAVTKSLSISLLIQKTIEKITTILPQIYYKTINSVINVGNYSLKRFVSIIKLAQNNINNIIKRSIVVSKQGSFGVAPTRQANIAINKATVLSITQSFQKMVEKTIVSTLSIIGNLMAVLPIDKLFLSVSALFTRSVSTLKSKFTKKILIKVDTEKAPESTQTVSYVKQKYRKSTIN